MDSFFADWHALMLAMLHWFSGGDPYGPYPEPAGHTYEAGYFAYPPPVLILAAPLALLPWWLSGLLVQSVAVVGFNHWARRTSGRGSMVWLILFPPLLQGLQIGQTTLIILVALMLAELHYRSGKDLWRACCSRWPCSSPRSARWRSATYSSTGCGRGAGECWEPL